MDKQSEMTTMKTETHHHIDDIAFLVTSYALGNGEDAKAVLTGCIADMEADEWRLAYDSRIHFPRKTERLESILQDYGPSDVYLSYMYDNFISWGGGKRIHARVENGQQAVRLIEHCLNTCGESPVARLIGLIGYTPISTIPCEVGEGRVKKSLLARESKRLLTMVTGAEHPHLMWREMWLALVAER